MNYYPPPIIIYSAPRAINNHQLKLTMTSKTVRGSFNNWMFTINNPIVNDLPDRFTNNCDFVTWQLEKGEKGTPHLQGYLVLKTNPKNKNGRTKKWLLENIAPMGVYFEPRMAPTHKQAIDYCNKVETRVAGPWTIGTKPDEGVVKGGRAAGAVHKRTVEDLLGDIKDGATDRQVLDKYPRLAMTMTKGIERARLILSQDETRVQPYCVVFHGPTGTGKSHRAAAIMANNGGGFIFRKGNSGNMWADGYDPIRHPVVVFEEMDGSFMPYRQLLRICDKWQLVLDTKGGAVNFCPKIIVFTAHKHPKEWYNEDSTKDITELMRRLTGAYGAIIEMKTPYVQPALDEPDLADIIDLLETGELVDQVKQIIDLTSDEDISEGGDLDHTPQDAWQGGNDVQVRALDFEDDGEYAQNTDDHWIDIRDAESNETEYRERYSEEDRDAMRRAQRVPLKRTDTSTIGIVKPPKAASPADFRAAGHIPGQSKLSWKKTQKVDDDDDVDDKCHQTYE